MKSLRNWMSAVKYLFLIFMSSEDQRKFHGYNLMKALEGDSCDKSMSSFRSTAAGARLLQQRPDASALLKDNARLAACPPGSLGQTYFGFMTQNNLRVDYLDDLLKLVSDQSADEEHRWYRVRAGSTHDLRHVLTGYGPDFLGEGCLVVFRYAQLRHTGLLLLTLFTFIHAMLTTRGPVLPSLFEAYRRGKQAADLDMLAWEEALNEPLSAQRALLRLTPIEHYKTKPVYPTLYAGVVPVSDFNPNMHIVSGVG